ncbi:hypothetical protein H7I76_19425 [Mycolicibacterium vaccae]|nr:hypothetical protein [Mycolicibacterium vaccae]
MKKLGLLSVVAGALSAVAIGVAGPAQAAPSGPAFGSHNDDSAYHHDNGYGHGFGHGYGNGYRFGYGYGNDSNNPWLGQLYPRVKVPHVDTCVRN